MVDCRPNSVLPQLGQLTNSVFELRILHPCSSEKLAVLKYSIVKAPFACGSISTPSPRPSVIKPPSVTPICSASSFFVVTLSAGIKWLTTGVWLSSFFKTSNSLRLA